LPYVRSAGRRQLETNTMRILAFSDLHRDIAQAEHIVAESHAVDIVVGAGDFATKGIGLDDTLFILRRLNVPFVLVPGNHEDLAELRTACSNWPVTHVLHGNSVQINGINFFGLGYGSGVVNPEPWNRALDELGAAKLLKDCPTNAVLVSHSPPFGVVDQQKDGRHDGSIALHETILRVQPKITFCGHVHNSWGQSGIIGSTPVHNIGPKPQIFVV
jgi:uncharacterized protein